MALPDEKQHAEVLIPFIIDRKISRFAEIGVYKGGLMRTILRSPASQMLHTYFAIDKWKEDLSQWKRLQQADWDDLYEGVCKYLPYFYQLRIMRMESVKASKLFWDGFFDMVYIDADHYYDSVVADIKAWLPKVRKGGVLAGHDYEPTSKQEKRQAHRAVDDMFGKDVKIEKCGVWIKEIV